MFGARLFMLYQGPCQWSPGKHKEDSIPMSNLPSISDADFQSTISSEGLTLIDFWATWCGPCRMLAPTLEALQEEMGDSVKIVKLNIEENAAVAAKYKVSNIPLMMLFKGGERIDQLLGNVPKNKIKAMIENHL